MGEDTRASVALLGLSGDPAHKGHLAVSQSLLMGGASSVWWSIAPANPFKVNRARLSYAHRHALAQILLQEEQVYGVELHDMEAGMQLSDEGLRTATFLRNLNKIYGDAYRFTFIMGSDNWMHFHEWGMFDEILDQASLLIFNRGNTIEELLSCPAGVRFAHLQVKGTGSVVPPGQWRLVPEFTHPASSTLVAQEVAETGHSEHLTAGQLAYIKKHGLLRK